MKIKNKVKSKKPIIALTASAVILIICAAAVVVYLNRDRLFGSQNNNSADQTVDTNQTDNSGSDSNKTTDDAADSSSDKTAEQQAPSSNSNGGSISGSTSAKSVTVSISDASQYGNTIEVRAYINGIVESDGTCTFTFTKDAKTITKTSASLTNPNYTNCETVSVPTSEFASKGTWQLKISYQSPKSQGSASTSLEIK